MGNHTIERTIELNASTEKVWSALTDHKKFGKWFRVRLDGPFLAGEITEGRMTYPGYEDMKFTAMIEKMDPEKYFSFRWHHKNDSSEIDYETEPTTLVEFFIEKTANGTKLTVKESGFELLPENIRSQAYRDNTGGWKVQMENIENYVKSHS